MTETVIIYNRAGERIQETSDISQEEHGEEHPKQNPEKQPRLVRGNQM